MITLNSFDSLIDSKKNGFGYMFEDFDNLNNAFLVFSRKNHPFLRAVIDAFVKDYDGNSWSKNGPILIKKTIHEYCKVANYLDIDLYGFKPASFSKNPSHPCIDMTLFPESYFYPLTYVRNEHKTIFEPNSSWRYPQLFDQIKDSYTIHLFNQLSSSFSAKVNDGSFFSAIAEKNCPETFNYAKSNNLGF